METLQETQTEKRRPVDPVCEKSQHDHSGSLPVGEVRQIYIYLEYVNTTKYL